MLRLRTFGGCVLERDGVPLDAASGQRKALALLALVAAAGDRGINRERLLAWLWPDSDDARARTSLKQLIHSLRRRLECPEVLPSAAVLRFDPRIIGSDVTEFRHAVRTGAHERAVELHAGPFLDGFYLKGADDFERWTASERASLEADLARVLESLAERDTARGAVRTSVEWWRRLVEVDPLSTRATLGFMQALGAAGEPAAALRHARSFEARVGEETGGSVDATVRALAARLLRQGAATLPSIAVLPFASPGGGPADELFSDGLTDELIGALGRLPGLRVTGRTSSYAVKSRGLPVPAIGETLGVASLLEGSVRCAGDRLKVGVQLVSAGDNRVLWAETYDREMRDLFAVQEEIARAIAEALRVRLAGPASSPARSADLVCYQLYLKGRYLTKTRVSREALHQAARYFDQAIAIDPAFAPAFAGLSDAHAYLAVMGYGKPREEFAAAIAAAREALRLDDTLADAHVSLAHCLVVHDFEWAAAEQEFRLAIALDSSNTTARLIFALCLQNQGRFDEAIAQLEAAKALDPLAPFLDAVLGRVYVNARMPEAALRPLMEVLAFAPELDVVHQQLGHAYLQLGRPAEAIAALRRAAELSGGRDSAHLAYGLAVTGARDEAVVILRHLTGPESEPAQLAFHIAMAYAGLGDADEALRWLEVGYTERASFMDGIKVTPAFDPLHDDPRWTALLRRMRLA